MRPDLPANVIDLDRALADHEALLHSQSEAMRLASEANAWRAIADHVAQREHAATMQIVSLSIAFLLGLGLGVLLFT